MSDWDDKLAIAEVIQNWALWRDTGDWKTCARRSTPMAP